METTTENNGKRAAMVGESSLTKASTRGTNPARDEIGSYIGIRLAVIRDKLTKNAAFTNEKWADYMIKLMLAGYSAPSAFDVWVQRYNDYQAFKTSADGKRKLASLGAMGLFMGFDLGKYVIEPYTTLQKYCLPTDAEKDTYNTILANLQAKFNWKPFYDNLLQTEDNQLVSDYTKVMTRKIVNVASGNSQDVLYLLKKGFWGVIRLDSCAKDVMRIMDNSLTILGAYLLNTSVVPDIKRNGSRQRVFANEKVFFEAVQRFDFSTIEKGKVPCFFNYKHLQFTVEAQSRLSNSRHFEEVSIYVIRALLTFVSTYAKNLAGVASVQDWLASLKNLGEENISVRIDGHLANMMSDLQYICARGKFGAPVKRERTIKTAKEDHNAKNISVLTTALKLFNADQTKSTGVTSSGLAIPKNPNKSEMPLSIPHIE